MVTLSEKYRPDAKSLRILSESDVMQGFRTFSNQAAMSAAKQNHLIDSVWRDLCPQSTDDFTRILEMHHKYITPHTLRPFLYTSERSTNLSFIHLVAQSLVDEHVCFAAIYYI